MEHTKTSTFGKWLLVCILAVIILLAVLWVYHSSSEKNRLAQDPANGFASHAASAKTERVGGLIPYNVKSDDIREIPEEFFFAIDESMTWEELIAEAGEPSGTVGSGIERDYWRIGEDKYAVTTSAPMQFAIWTGEGI